jgi:hypothetical protein
MVSAGSSSPRRWISLALVGIQLAIVLLIGRNWAYVTTYRLYLDHRTDANERSAAAQSFDIEGRQVLPRIVTRGPDRIAFRTDIRQDSTIHAQLRAPALAATRSNGVMAAPIVCS